MTATSVYGIAIGDSFRDDDGEVFKVISFVTPPSMTAKWIAIVKGEEGESEFPVEDLLNMQEVYT
jgi:hypothetical protein